MNQGRQVMSRSNQFKQSFTANLLGSLQALLTDQLRRMQEHSAAAWSDDAPNRAWSPRPDRIYRSVGATFGRPR